MKVIVTTGSNTGEREVKKRLVLTKPPFTANIFMKQFEGLCGVEDFKKLKASPDVIVRVLNGNFRRTL